MNNLIKFLKLIFYFLNTILIILYLFPGSIFGYFLYNDLNIQPQITRDFIISSNHFYAFALLSFFGFFAHHKTKNLNFLSLYLIFLSIILEFFHLIIPNRGFEFSDLFGNLAGVIFVVIIYKVISRYA
ncbi:hypothetical protein OAX49_00595 [Candidatus Pelagibacter sp.]|nr:hypothetical protein [Candidatus Pelagibacter sp.]